MSSTATFAASPQQFELDDVVHSAAPGFAPTGALQSSAQRCPSDEIRRTTSNDSHILARQDALSSNEPVALQTEDSNLTKPARANLIILQVSAINAVSSMTSGLIVVGLPQIVGDLSLPERLYLWPASVYNLTSGSMLLVAGAVTDVIGPRSVDLVGCAILGSFVLACGLSQTGIQLVMFRALQGVGYAMHIPCSVSLVAQYVPSGRRRNIGFACLSLAFVLGYYLGQVLGGVFADTIGWRAGFYITGGSVLILTLGGFRVIPPDTRHTNVLWKLRSIDWVGAAIACASLAMFSYMLALLSTDSSNIKAPSTVVTLTLSIILMLVFPIWMHFQEKGGRSALVPNSLWRSLPFSCMCLLTVIVLGNANSMAVFSSLYFQEVQALSALQASLRLLPALFVGLMLNFSTGYMIDRAPVFWLLFTGNALASISPLLMALTKPRWSYWKGPFFAQVLAPLSVDVLLTVGQIVVSEVFPEDTQALAGAVFNTVSNFGQSLGLSLMQVVSLLVTKDTQYRDKSSPSAILVGYRASFWTMFATTILCMVICTLGLRNIGKVGLKRD